MTDTIDGKIFTRLKHAHARGGEAMLTHEMVSYIMNNITSIFSEKVVARAEKEEARRVEKARLEKNRKERDRQAKIRKQIKLPEIQTITNQKVKAIKADRKAGMTFAQIAIKHSVAITTAMRYSSEEADEKMKQHQRNRYERLKNDPVWLEKHRAKMKAYAAKRRQEKRNANA